MAIKHKMQHIERYFLQKGKRNKDSEIRDRRKSENDRDKGNERKRGRGDGCRSESEIRSCKGIKNTFI